MQDIGEQVSCRYAQVSHDAEVDGHHRAVGFDEQITGVDIGVEESVSEGLLEEDARRAFEQHLAFDAESFERFAIVDPDAVDPL